MAIFESIRRRLQKQRELLEELENLPPAQRAKRLAQLQGRLTDAEQEEDDRDDAERDLLADEFTSAVELDQLRSEIAALQELLARARRVKDLAADSKLTALRDCLKRAEFGELSDGRGKLLVFTEHRDTLKHLLEHLQKWGYTTCEIHGGMNPHERKRAQEDFRTARQVCVATEAAGGRHQPAILPVDGELRPALEPDAPGAAPGAHPSHRPGAGCPRLQLRGPPSPRKGNR